MTGPIHERDWKYLRSLHESLLNELCSRILTQVGRIAAGEEGSSHQRYLTLWRRLKGFDAIVGECFDDWRRSRIHERILALRRHKLLTDEHVTRLSESAQDWLHMVESQ
jgi:hypothetical protein